MQAFINKKFVFSDYAKAYGNDNALECNKKTIEEWVNGSTKKDPLRKGDDTKLLLSSLPEYIIKGNYYYEQDHLHPRTTFKAGGQKKLQNYGFTPQQIVEFDEQIDCIGNLQLYRDRKNQKKGNKPLDEWMKGDSNRSFKYDPKDIIEKEPTFPKGDSAYSLGHYELFIQKRSELICDALIALLCK